jgi:protein SCO1/2
MDHSTFTYLASPGRPFVTFFRSDATPEEVAESVACHSGSSGT